MVNRRQFLLYSGASVLGGCVPKHVAKVSEMFQNKPYYVEKRLRYSPLSVNKSRNLRRYKGLIGDPSTRELELIVLTRREKCEESFLYASPENVWYEIGIQFENDVGEKHEKSAAVYSSRVLSAVDLLFNGKNKDIAKPKKLVNYHYHPVFLRAYNVYMLGEKRMKKETKFNSLEEWAYHACLIPSPPSMGDYIVDETFKHRLKGVESLSRVADHSNIWEFELNRDFMAWLKSTKLTFTEYQNYWKLFENVFVSVDKDMFFGKTGKSAKSYVNELKKRVKRLNLPYDAINLKHKTVLTNFHPTQNEFKAMLKTWGLIS
ncbi:hypothetical protein D6777_04240 [Candidatus Woesearchaeota archaeon]|nr:MAG: hypothetical protein D6777_04240 [Candidatus Woesearchaeota archaeon]